MPEKSNGRDHGPAVPKAKKRRAAAAPWGSVCVVEDPMHNHSEPQVRRELIGTSFEFCPRGCLRRVVRP